MSITAQFKCALRYLHKYELTNALCKYMLTMPARIYRIIIVPEIKCKNNESFRYRPNKTPLLINEAKVHSPGVYLTPISR